MVHTVWVRTHVKTTLKHDFMKLSLLQFADLGYGFAGEQQGSEQVEDREGIFI